MTYTIDLVNHRTGVIEPDAINVYTPSEWAELDPRNWPANDPDDDEYFVGHHSDWTYARTLDTLFFAANQINRLHIIDNGWTFSGYNWFFSALPRTVIEMRGDAVQAGATRGYNTRSTAVCVGGDMRTDPYTDEMRDMMVSLYWHSVADRTQRGLEIRNCTTCGQPGNRTLRRLSHRDVNATSCPGDPVAAHMQTEFPIPVRSAPIAIPPTIGLPTHVKIPLQNAATFQESFRKGKAELEVVLAALSPNGRAHDEATSAYERFVALQEYWAASVRSGQTL